MMVLLAAGCDLSALLQVVSHARHVTSGYAEILSLCLHCVVKTCLATLGHHPARHQT